VAADGRIIPNAELERRYRLLEPLDLLSRRRLCFVTKAATRPTCQMARQILFTEVVSPSFRKVSGRTRSSYLHVLDLDLRYLYSEETEGKNLSSYLAEALIKGPPYVKKMLKALKPDISRGSSLKLVVSDEDG
jgi:hypothetical protein